ncbi:MAG: c-type cytochrome [Gammaproteobacteria bacterium]|nr:c-type cytochrome [Gammaproteobacteria bacterium]
MLLGGVLVAEAAADAPAYRHFDEPQLAHGRVVWLANCEGCHGYGTAGAPIPSAPADWRERVRKPLDVLYRHAIDGFFGPDDTMMPPRGGNPSLSDNDVRAAVDYMTRLAHSYLQQAE